jgi:predicted enzyme related to lactoylglutathione lyase
MIKGMAFVAYSVKDVPKAKEFYRDIIGLTPGEMFGDQWAEFDVDGIAFGIGNGASIGIEPGSQFSAMFEVDDLSAMRKSLKDRGIEVTDIMESPVCSSCFVTDPDGNRFGLHQRKS